MASADSMPPELLLLVARDLPPYELNAFARASRKYRRVFNPALYTLVVRPLHGLRLLHWAVEHDRPGTIKHAIDAGVDVNQRYLSESRASGQFDPLSYIDQYDGLYGSKGRNTGSKHKLTRS